MHQKKFYMEGGEPLFLLFVENNLLAVFMELGILDLASPFQRSNSAGVPEYENQLCFMF